MSPLDQQFEAVRMEFPAASIEARSGGSALITVPDFPVPTGWSKDRTMVRFLAPVGYPFAQPDCFWACADLRLAGGAMPHATNLTPIPETNVPLLWFSWHVQKWNPSRDTLMSFVRVIEKRLRDPR